MDLARATRAEVPASDQVDCAFEGEDGVGGVEGGAVHLGCDGVAGEEFGGEGWYELRAGWAGRQPAFLAAERQDHGHPVMDVADYLVGLGREDGEVDVELGPERFSIVLLSMVSV